MVTGGGGASTGFGGGGPAAFLCSFFSAGLVSDCCLSFSFGRGAFTAEPSDFGGGGAASAVGFCRSGGSGCMTICLAFCERSRKAATRVDSRSWRILPCSVCKLHRIIINKIVRNFLSSKNALRTYKSTSGSRDGGTSWASSAGALAVSVDRACASSTSRS